MAKPGAGKRKMEAFKKKQERMTKKSLNDGLVKPLKKLVKPKRKKKGVLQKLLGL